MYCSNEIFPNIRIVLVNPSHAGNIGATARAMKNMGFFNLFLVAPKNFPHVDAIVRSAGAEEILDQAKVVTSLSQAIADCNYVIGTSARLRDLPLTLLSPQEASEKIIFYAQNKNNQVAIIFGRESSGLTNEELMQCNSHLHISTNPEFSSLNLASSVQIVTYEIRLLWLELTKNKQSIFSNNCFKVEQHTNDKFDTLATSYEMNLFYKHLEQTLIKLNYLNPNNPRKLMARLQRLFNRAGIEHLEINILRGILDSIDKK